MKSSNEAMLKIEGLEISYEMIDALDFEPSAAGKVQKTLEQALEDPALSVYRDLLLFLKKHEGKPVIVSEKDVENYKKQIPVKLLSLLKSNPALTLQSALSHMLHEMPAVYSEKFLLEVVKFIGKEWKSIRCEAMVREEAAPEPEKSLTL